MKKITSSFVPASEKEDTIVYPAFRMWKNNGTDGFNGGIVMFTNESNYVVMHVPKDYRSARYVGEFIQNSTSRIRHPVWVSVSGTLTFDF